MNIVERKWNIPDADFEDLIRDEPPADPDSGNDGEGN